MDSLDARRYTPIMSERTQRRLAAIVSADVVGYSRLIGADEVGTLAALRTHRTEMIDPLIANFGGRIVKTMGDGLLLEFPSVVDATDCALEFQKGMASRNADVPETRQIIFRIGINLGDIIIDGDDIHGDGVNVAARLQEMAEPGGLAIAGRVHDEVRHRLEVSFEDAGAHELKNIANPVPIWRWSPHRPMNTGAINVSSPVLGFDGRPAIAVLAFDNLSRDPDQEFLADGIAEDILTRLAMWRWLPVIARNSSFTYKGRNVDVKDIGLELGARYILEGSVRKAGNRVRVTGQLIDAETGHHIWADRYDCALEDIFALQDEITEAIVSALEPAMGRAEMQRAQRKNPQNLDAWGYYQRGMWYLSKVTQRDLEQANNLLREAMLADPDFAPPYAGLAFLGFLGRSLSYSLQPVITTADAHAAATRAVRLDEMDPFAHAALGITRTLAGEYDAAVASANRSVTLNPSYAFGYHALHIATSMTGDFPASIKACRQACRISPNDPWLFYFLTGVSGCHYMMREYEQGIEAGQIAVEQYSQYANSHRWLAMSLAQIGRMDEAKSEIQKYLSLTPNAYEAARDAYPFRNQADLDHYRDGLRKAGIKV